MTAANLGQFKQRLAKRTGLDHGLLEQAALGEFLQRRCRELNLADTEAYFALVLREMDELERLVQEVSVSETWFFRYPASFELLAQHASELLHGGQSNLRMLSIACSTGEEPYSMAIAAAQAGWPLERVVVEAVDRNKPSIARAREGLYQSVSFRVPVPRWADRWFHRRTDGIRIDDRIAASVEFLRDDILNPASLLARQTYDVVFCRNLFIYLGPPARKKLIDFLSSVVDSAGLLFVGHAEYAILPPDAFSSAGVQHAFALRPGRHHLASEAERANDARPAGHIKLAPRRSVLPTVVSSDRRKQLASTTPQLSSRRDSAPQRAEARITQASLEEARAMADTGQLDAAIVALERLAADQPEADVFDLLGSIRLSLGQLDAARGAFRRALYLDPNHETALLQMAIVHDRLGESGMSERYRKRAARAHDTQSDRSSGRKK